MSKQKGAEPAQQAGNRSSDVVAGLAGSIAHDFSNLLMIIRNAAGFLREDLDAADPCQEHVSDLLHAADRARQLTEQLQAIGRSQLLKPEVVWPAEIVHGIADTLRHLVPADVEFRIVVRAKDAPVLFDATQLPILVMRMLAYAAEQARSHGHLVLVLDEKNVDKKTAAAQDVKAGRFVSLVIASTGRTLDELEKQRAFEPRLAGKHLPKGTDLRLASVHGVVRQSGGFVDATSEEGHGLVLAIYLPVVTKARVLTPAQRRVRVHHGTSGSEIILVVEDDAAVRTTVRDALERFGYTVLVAPDGAAALRLMQVLSQPPDLLLTDLVMPEVTGRELIENLRLESRLPKVLLMSGYTDDDVLRRSSPSEMYPFIKKPFTHQELAAKVRQTLDTKRPAR